MRQECLALVDPSWDCSQAVVVEVGWGTRSEYAVGHIPGAIYLDTDRIEADTRPAPLPRQWWNLHSPKELRQALAEHAIPLEKPVLIYSRDVLAAARLCWALLLLGHPAVHWLDGGWQAWVGANRPISVEVPQHPRATLKPSVSSEHYQNARFLWTTPQVEHRSPTVSLIDIRSIQEHRGLESGYDYIQPSGRIPHSIWGGGGRDNSSLEDFFDENLCLRPLSQIADFWWQRKISCTHTLVFYCGTGWRASVAFCVAYLLGWKDIAVYDGGWYEWSMGPGHQSRMSAQETE